MPHIRLQAIDGQNHTRLLLQACLDALVICHAQRHQFFIALHQIGHTAFRDAHATSQQGPVHLWHAPVLAKAPPANQSNHLQAKFPVWERPASLFFGTVGHMIARTLRLDTATHHYRQLPEPIQLGHRAMAVVADPQQLAALFTRLFQRGQCDRVRRFRTWGSGSSDHGRSPVELFTFLLSFRLHLLSSSLFRSGPSKPCKRRLRMTIRRSSPCKMWSSKRVTISSNREHFRKRTRTCRLCLCSTLGCSPMQGMMGWPKGKVIVSPSMCKPGRLHCSSASPMSKVGGSGAKSPSPSRCQPV